MLMHNAKPVEENHRLDFLVDFNCCTFNGCGSVGVFKIIFDAQVPMVNPYLITTNNNPAEFHRHLTFFPLTEDFNRICLFITNVVSIANTRGKGLIFHLQQILRRVCICLFIKKCGIYCERAWWRFNSCVSILCTLPTEVQTIPLTPNDRTSRIIAQTVLILISVLVVAGLPSCIVWVLPIPDHFKNLRSIKNCSIIHTNVLIYLS